MFTVTNVTISSNYLALQYSTFLGSSNNDVATGITADDAGNAYVVGWTTSTNFPDTTTSNSLQLNSYVRTNTTGFVFATNAFLTQITWDGVKASNGFSRMFGGFGVDVANGVALDGAGNIFIVGSASSTNFPVTGANLLGSLRATNSGPNLFAPGASDVFVTVFKADFSTLLYSTYLGGNLDDFGQGIAVDTNGDAYVTGQTLSTNFPVLGTWSTNSPALHSIRVGTNDAFLAKIITAVAAPQLNIQKSGTNALVYWPALADVTPANLPLETTTNLVMKITNVAVTVIGYTYKTNNNIITTNPVYSTNHFPAFVGTTNWTVVTNPLPVLINSNYTYTFSPTYLFNPTNAVRFYRFHRN